MNEILEKSALSEHQKEKAREIRRKGKNKVVFLWVQGKKSSLILIKL